MGASHSSLGPVDTNPKHSAPISRCRLLRHSSFVRAVCADANVRICAEAVSDERPYRDGNATGEGNVLVVDDPTGTSKTDSRTVGWHRAILKKIVRFGAPAIFL